MVKNTRTDVGPISRGTYQYKNHGLKLWAMPLSQCVFKTKSDWYFIYRHKKIVTTLWYRLNRTDFLFIQNIDPTFFYMFKSIDSCFDRSVKKSIWCEDMYKESDQFFVYTKNQFDWSDFVYICLNQSSFFDSYVKNLIWQENMYKKSDQVLKKNGPIFLYWSKIGPTFYHTGM